jgi:Endonuclease/Exonuclease/phosphatase family
VLNELFGGQAPELLGVAEVEGDDVFEELLSETGNTHLQVVKDPAGTSDLRGIDVALAYDDRKLSVAEQHSHVVHFRYPTHDIFEVVFSLVETGERLVVIASHWPSPRLGRERSEPLRCGVAENIAYLVRDLAATGLPSSRTSVIGYLTKGWSRFPRVISRAPSWRVRLNRRPGAKTCFSTSVPTASNVAR